MALASEVFSYNLLYAVGKEETTKGTFNQPVSSDFDTRLYEINIAPTVEQDNDSEKYATGGHGMTESIAGAQSMQFTATAKMSNAGDATTAPKLWKFFKACGAKTVTYSSAGVALQPLEELDSSTISISIYAVEKGSASPKAVEFQIAGAMGNAVISTDGVGKPLSVAFTFTGKLHDIKDVTSQLSLTGQDTALAYKMLDATMSTLSVEQRISSFSLDFGNEITPLVNQSESTGYEYYNIASRKPTLSINPLLQLTATEDILDNVKTSATGNLLLTIDNTYDLRIAIPKGQLMMPSVANREGHIGWEQTWRCLRSGAVGSGISDSTLPAEDAWEILIGETS